MDKQEKTELTVAIVGLGYVGIQLAASLGGQYTTIGFDPDSKKLESYRQGADPTGEVSFEQLSSATKLSFTDDPSDLKNCHVFIVAVPTPIDKARRPDFGSLVAASRTVGKVMSPDSVVIYESTVYPGATEEVCVPVLEEYSGLKWPQDFHIGYSPERINPGDGDHTLQKIVKVVSADSPETLEMVAKLYGSIIGAGIHIAPSIRVAEAAKVIENTQRDLNIALVNELAVIFERMGISTIDVLEAAGTKWNFLPFRPGLVGGHCIGVDPYYLTYKAQELGYHPDVILAGRRINDGMGKFVAEQTIKRMLESGCEIRGSRVNVYGFSFKENCSDLRNTQVIEVVRELRGYGVEVYITDAFADIAEARQEYGESLLSCDNLPECDAVILAVTHKEYQEAGLDFLLSKLRRPGVFIDIKSVYCAADLEPHGVGYWSL